MLMTPSVGLFVPSPSGGGGGFTDPSTYAANTIGYWLAQASTVKTDPGSGLVAVSAQDDVIGRVESVIGTNHLNASPDQSIGGPLWNPADTPDDILFNPPTKSTLLSATVGTPYTSDKLYMAWDGFLPTQIGGNGRILTAFPNGGNDTDATALILAFCSAANAIRPYRNGFLATAQSFVDGDRVKVMFFCDGSNYRWRCKIASASVVEVTGAMTGNFNIDRVRMGKGTGAGEHANMKAIKAYVGFNFTLTMADNMDTWWLAN